MSEDPSRGRDAVLEVGAVTMALLMLLSVTAVVSLSAPPPLAAKAGDDVVVEVGETVIFNGTASTGAVPLQFLWFFGNGDAALGGLPSFADEAEAEFAYGSEGVYEAILILTDGLGRTDVDTRLVTVRNVLPTAVIAADGEVVESLEVEEDEALVFDGSLSEDTESLSYHWTFGDGEEGDGVEVTHAYTAAGTYLARLEVMDAQGARNRSAVVVQVRNVEPVAAASFPTGAAEDEAVTFDASVTFDTPSDLPALEYVWDLGDGTVKLGRTVTHAYGLAGTYDVRLTVVDDNGASSTVEGALTVTNEAPVAVTDQLLVAEEGATVFFDASGSEDTSSDLPLLKVAWDFDLDGETDARGFRATHVFADEGVHSVDVDVTDDDGARDGASPRVDVANVAPSAGILGAFRIVDVNLTVAGTPGHTIAITIFEGSAILAEGSSTRRATDPAEHRVVFDGLRFSLAEGFVAVVEYEPLLDELGDNPAWLNLTYEDGTSVSLFHNFNVEQEETHLWAVDLNPLLTGLPVHLVGYAYDPGADDLTLQWDLGDGTTHGFDHHSGGVPTRVTHEVVHTFGLGTFTVTFEAEDEDGGVGGDEAVVTSSEDGLFIDNIRPRAELGGVRQAAEDEALVFEAIGQDTASDREDLSYLWLFRDGSQAVGPTVEHAFAQAGTYHVLLVVTDPHGESTVDSVRVEVANLPPVPAFGAVGPAEEDEPLTFHAATTADTPSDQPTLRYRWDFGDGAVATGPLAVHSYPRAGTYTVTLLVQDDNGAFASISQDVEVVNRVPTAAFDGPAEVFVEDAAQLVSTSEDTPTDAALLDLAWAVDDAQASGRTVTVTGLAPAEIAVDLTVTDDDGAADDASKTLLVKNRPPEAHIPFDVFFVYGEQPEAAFRGLAFDTLDDQDDLTFAWSFGDGSTAAGPTATHTYGASGSFTLTFTVTDPHGVVVEDTAVVNVILDADLDGLPDLYETAVSETDPTSNDSDGDRVLDPFEILVLGTDPLLQDTDFDAWTDFEEVFAVHGYMTKPLVNDTDGDGMADGSEHYGQAFRTAKRFALPQGEDVTVSLTRAGANAPAFAIERAEARIGIVHPRPGDLTVTISQGERTVPVGIEFPEAPDLFVSVDLLVAGFMSAELSSPLTWQLSIDNMGGRGTLEYFEVHIVARTSPLAADSDGDGLNDTEEASPGEDGWLTNPWRGDTDGDGITDWLETHGWRRSGTTVAADPQGFRTDPTRRDTDRDGFSDGDDMDPLHDLMVRLTIGTYIALDPDPDCDDSVGCINDPRTPEPFVGVVYRGRSFYTPHADPDTSFVIFNKVYTLDVLDNSQFATLTLQAWDDDILVDKQWDLSPTESFDHVVTFDILLGTEGTTSTSGSGTDRDAFLSFRIDSIRQPRINTVFVDSLDVDDLVSTSTGDLRYLGDQVFYVAWIEVTTPKSPLVVGLNVILLPRFQFLNSSVNHTLRTTTNGNLLPDHLRPLTFTGFDDEADETTNAIAGLLHGTVTGDQALALLEDLGTGKDGTVNGAATVVTSHLVTLGLADDVVNAVPYSSVRFDLPTGRPPGDILDPIRDFVGAFVGAAVFLVQGLVLIGEAIADFFAQAKAFLVELGMAVIGAIGTFLGQVAEAVQEAGRVLLETASLVLREAEQLMRDVLQRILGNVPELMEEMVLSLGSTLTEAAPASSTNGGLDWEAVVVSEAIIQVLLPFLTLVILALTSILALEIILGVLTGGFGFILSTLSERALSIILSFLLVAVIVGLVPLVEDLISGEDVESFASELFGGIGFFGAVAGAVFEALSSVQQLLAGKFSLFLRALGVALAIAGLTITLLSALHFSGFALFLVDLVAALLAGVGLVFFFVARRSDPQKPVTFFAKFSANLELGLVLAGTGGSVLTVLAHNATGAYEE